MERILVAVDEDEQAPRVIELAGEVAQACGATLTICHVMPRERYHRIEEQQEREQVAVPFSMTQGEERAAELAAEYARPLVETGVTFTTAGRVGEPAPTIVALAREIDADLIIMGFEALRGLERIRALGSVSRAVMETTRRPVMVVPAVRE
ncbi:MAG: universal stress protein [Anaerolineae bacterium]|nr:universal stress protein [Anaerolineae bacterium]